MILDGQDLRGREPLVHGHSAFLRRGADSRDGPPHHLRHVEGDPRGLLVRGLEVR